MKYGIILTIVVAIYAICCINYNNNVEQKETELRREIEHLNIIKKNYEAVDELKQASEKTDNKIRLFSSVAFYIIKISGNTV